MKHFSEREEKIIKIIGRRKMTLEEISRALFKVAPPMEPTISVANSARRIILKCVYHKLPWTLEKVRKDGKLYIRRTACRR